VHRDVVLLSFVTVEQEMLQRKKRGHDPQHQSTQRKVPRRHRNILHVDKVAAKTEAKRYAAGFLLDRFSENYRAFRWINVAADRIRKRPSSASSKNQG
jgi:hypothetical protein